MFIITVDQVVLTGGISVLAPLFEPFEPKSKITGQHLPWAQLAKQDTSSYLKVI